MVCPRCGKLYCLCRSSSRLENTLMRLAGKQSSAPVERQEEVRLQVRLLPTVFTEVRFPSI